MSYANPQVNTLSSENNNKQLNNRSLDFKYVISIFQLRKLRKWGKYYMEQHASSEIL